VRGPAERAQPHIGAGSGPLLVAVLALLAYDLWQGLGDWQARHFLAVGAACLGALVLWRELRLERRRNGRLTAQLTAVAAEADERQRAVSDLFVNLARRNQSLLDRQLGLIGELEQKEQAPDALAELFELDHLATRIRRNAESLLVLSGDDPARRWGRPVQLAEVVRAAAAEVEDYRRVDVRVGDHVEVAGRAVADVAHLLAELIENATTYSPTHRKVMVRSHATVGRPGVVVAVEDTGIGMADAHRQAANRVLAEPLVLDLRGRTMGLHVVSRLARRYDVEVELAPTPGGGVTALVTLPASLVTQPEPTAPRSLHLVRGGPAVGARPGSGPAGAATLGAGHRVTPPPGLARRPRPSPTPPPAPEPQPPPPEPPEPPERLRTRAANREQTREMLSRFQASQRAGRAVADATAGSLAPDRSHVVTPEESP